MNHKLSFFDKLKAYKLTNNVYVLILLTVSMFLSLACYVFPIFQPDSFFPNWPWPWPPLCWPPFSA